jgi:hypothetical protein
MEAAATGEIIFLQSLEYLGSSLEKIREGGCVAE